MGESINAAEIKKILEDNEERLRRYVSLLVKANELARLTGPSDEETLWRAHVADCASAVPLLPERGAVIDVGTGGGLPGIVWAVCRPGLRVTLLDSITRKCALVDKIAAAMGLANVSVVCSRSEDYAKKQAEKLEHDILRTYFSAYEPQEEILHDIRFRYYADTGSRFLGCYQYEGVWVASYSKRLLEQVVRKQLLPQEQADEDELSPFFRQFDRNATANLLFPSDGWQIQVARHDTILWKYNLPWVCTDLFPSEGNICGFCSFPYAVPNDSLYEAMGDSLAIQLEALFPRLHVTPQTSQDSSEVYFTFCSPL